MRTVVEVHQGVNLRGNLQQDVSSVAAIAAVWTAQRLKLFTVHRRASVASVAGLQVKYDAVNKTCHEVGFLALTLSSCFS